MGRGRSGEGGRARERTRVLPCLFHHPLLPRPPTHHPPRRYRFDIKTAAPEDGSSGDIKALPEKSKSFKEAKGELVVDEAPPDDLTSLQADEIVVKADSDFTISQKNRFVRLALERMPNLPEQVRDHCVLQGDTMSMPEPWYPEGRSHVPGKKPPPFSIKLNWEATTENTPLAPKIVVAFKFVREIKEDQSDYADMRQAQLTHVAAGQSMSIMRQVEKDAVAKVVGNPESAKASLGSALLDRNDMNSPQCTIRGGRAGDVNVVKAVEVRTNTRADDAGGSIDMVCLTVKNKILQAGTCLTMYEMYKNQHRCDDRNLSEPMKTEFEKNMHGKTVITEHSSRARAYRIKVRRQAC